MIREQDQAERGRVLVVDDEPEVLASLRRQLRREFEVFTAEDAEHGYGILERHPVQVIVSDQRMPRVTGAEFLARAREVHPGAVRLLLTGYADLQAVIEAVNSGQIFRYITKPWDPVEIRTVVREAYRRYSLESENRGLVEALRQVNAELEQRVEERTRELGESEARYRAIVEGTSDPVMLLDRAERITAVNPAFSRITGYTEEEVLERSPSLLASGRHSAGYFDAIRRALREQGEWCGAIWNRRKDGSLYARRLKARCARDGAGEPSHYVCLYTDLDAEADTLDRVWADAQHDALTGLPNRALFRDRLDSALAATGDDGAPLALLFLDLDGFKPVNDTHGHGVGDELLQAVAERLRETVRQSDTVARLGGDEFVVLLRRLRQAEDAELLAGRLAEVIAAPVDTSAGPVSVGASIGRALYPDDGSDADALLQRADADMYAVKKDRKFPDLVPDREP